MSTHSTVVGGSSADRVINCPASVQLSADIPPQKTSTYAQEGTVCHGIMEKCLLDYAAPSEDLIGQTIDQVEITSELFHDKILPAWEFTLDAFKRFSVGEFEPESQVHFRSVEGAFGTVDIMAKGRDDLVVILDYKFGAGEMISPVENKQLMFYAAAAMEDGAFDGWFDGHHNQPVVLGIIQPTDEHVLKTWETTVGALRSFTGLLGLTIAMSERPNLIPNMGSWCKWCPASAVCPAQNAVAIETLQLKDELLDELGEAMARATQLEAWIKSVKTLAHQQLERGQEITGFKLVKKRATRKWADAKTAMAKLRASKKILKADYVTEKLISPPQLEKICLSKGIDFDKFAPYIEAVSSGNTMVAASDRRDGIKVAGKRDIPQGLADKMK